MRPRFLVMGAGGIGGLVAASLLEAGHDVTTITTNAAVAQAIKAHGFRVVRDGVKTSVRGDAVATIPNEIFDYVLLATQPPQVEEAVANAVPFLAETGALVCFQNGLCEARVAAIEKKDRTLGGIIAWGATMPEPGLYERTATGGFTLGRMDGRPDTRLQALASALGCIGPVEITSNLEGKRWSKLAINCAISTLGTLMGQRLGALLRHRIARRLALEVMNEVVDVARQEHVRLEKVAGTLDLNWIALGDDERHRDASHGLVIKHALLLAVGLRFRRMRSSMLSAIERGRPPPIDFLNGEIVTRGRRHNVPTPVNEALCDAVRQLSRREKQPGIALLREVFLATGPRGSRNR